MNQDTRTEDYLAAWSLQRDPFDETHEAAFFYAGNALSQRLDLLTHLIQFGESVVVVSGPAGSGKTALLEQFAANIGPKCTLCLLNGADFDQLAPHLAEAVAGPVDADPTGLVEHWLRHADSTRQLVLAIDDADRLDDEACSRLCELVHRPGREQLRVLLFGAGEIQERVRRALDGLPEPHNSQLLEIPRLDEEETASYLMYRLAVAGYSGESPFTPTEVRAICKAADGRPGAINTLARQALIEHCQRLRGKKSRPAAAQGTGGIRRLALAGVVLFAAVLGYLGWRQFGASDHPSASAPLRPPGLPASTTHALPLPQPHAPDQDPSSASSTADGGRDRTGSGSEEYTEPAARRAAAGEENAGTSIQATATGIPDRAQRPHATDRASSREGTGTSTVMAETGPEPRANTEAKLGPGPETAALPAPAHPPAATAAATEKASLPAAAKTDAGGGTGDPAGPHDESWLLTRPPAHFTLQLLGSRDPVSIREYLRRHRLDPARAAVYRGEFKGGEWHVLLYGDFPDKAAALAAREALPAAIRRDKPWPRTFASVRKSIKQTRPADASP